MNPGDYIFLLSGLFPVVVIVSVLLFKKAMGTVSVTRLLPYTYAFWVGFMLQGLIGSYLMLWGFRAHPGLKYVTGDMQYVRSVIAVVMACFLVPLTMLAIGRLFNFNATKEVPAYQAKIVTYGTPAEESRAFEIITVVTVVVLIVDIYVIWNSPLVYSFMEPRKYIELATSRIVYTFEESIALRIMRNIIGVSFSAALSYITFAYALTTKKWKWSIVFAMQVIPTLFIQSANLAKAPASLYILGLMMIVAVVRGGLKVRYLAIGMAMSVGLLMFAYVQSGKEQQLEKQHSTQFESDNPVSRIVLGQTVGLPNYFAIFPAYHPYLNGSELQALSLIGKRPKSAARIAMELYSPEGVKHGTAGVQNTFCSGAAYANFGWVGVFFGPMWIGIVLQLVAIFIYRRTKTPLMIGWGIWIMFQLSKAIGAGFMSEFVLNTNIIGTSVLVFAMSVVLHARREK